MISGHRHSSHRHITCALRATICLQLLQQWMTWWPMHRWHFLLRTIQWGLLFVLHASENFIIRVMVLETCCCSDRIVLSYKCFLLLLWTGLGKNIFHKSSYGTTLSSLIFLYISVIVTYSLQSISLIAVLWGRNSERDPSGKYPLWTSHRENVYHT